MVPFFVQIKCQLGKSYEVANRLADAEIASEIYSTAGEFDLLIKVYVDGGTDIGHFVNEKVQTVPGIQDTRTIITFKAFDQDTLAGPSDSRLAAQTELALAPDHEQAGCRDDRRADIDIDRRHLAEHPVAEHERPHHRRVVERRDHRRRRVAVALGEKDVRECRPRGPRATNATSCQPFGQIQPNGSVASPASAQDSEK